MKRVVAAAFSAACYLYRTYLPQNSQHRSTGLIRLLFLNSDDRDFRSLSTIFLVVACVLGFTFQVDARAQSGATTIFNSHVNTWLTNPGAYSNGLPTALTHVQIVTTNTLTNQPISGAFALNMSGNAYMRSLSVGNGNTYNVNLPSNARHLFLGSSSPTESLITVTNNSTLSFSLTGSGTVSLVSSGNFRIDSGSSLNVTAAITGTAAISKTGAGIATFSGVNTYSGGTNINGGTLAVANAAALGSTGTISFGGGTLQYNGITTDFSSRFSTAANQAYSINTNGNNVSFAGTLVSSGGSMFKSGNGTLTLTGTGNTYNGGTTVGAGVLVATGPLANQSFHVASGATLQSSAALNATGNNTINGTVNGDFNLLAGGTLKGDGTLTGAVQIGGKLAAGNSIGLLKIDGSVTFGANSIFEVEIDTVNPPAADLVAVKNVLSLNNAELSLVDFANANSPVALGTEFQIATFGTLSGRFLGLNEGARFDRIGNTWAISYGITKPGAITLTAVPEPSAFLFVGVGLGWHLLRRRTRPASQLAC